MKKAILGLPLLALTAAGVGLNAFARYHVSAGRGGLDLLRWLRASAEYGVLYLPLVLLFLFTKQSPWTRPAILYVTVLLMIGRAADIYVEHILVKPDRYDFFFIEAYAHQGFIAFAGSVSYFALPRLVLFCRDALGRLSKLPDQKRPV